MAKKVDYNNWSKEELIKEITRIKETTYGLVWHRDLPEEKVDILINPDARTPSELFSNEIAGKPFPILKESTSKALNTKGSELTNLLIEGDNYHSLAVLNFTHQSAVDFIYIDPPYNTGNDDFSYNDKRIDKEDPFRHSKWLSFMERRLKLAQRLLKESGVIFISIDDNEQAPLKMLCDEIFGEQNFISTLVWENKEGGGKADSNFFRIKHEYVLVYAREINQAKIYGLPVEDEDRYKLNDKHFATRGRYQIIKLDSASLGYVASLDYPIKAPDGSLIHPNKDDKKISRWRWSKEKFEWGIQNDFVVFKKDRKGGWAVYTKQYLNCDNEGNLLNRTLQPIGVIAKYSTTQSNRLQKEMFGQAVFSYSKPIELIKYLIQISCKNDAVVLDFMAGSGTTGHAVLALNKEDDGSRRFILCTNNENDICTNICYPRIKKAVKGYTNASGEKIDGLGSNLRYYTCDFVEAEPSDKNKRKLVNESTDMLCIREAAFEPVKEGNDFKIFKGAKNYLGVVFHEDAIDDYKKVIKKIDGHFNTYVFSLGDEPHEKEFEDVKSKVRLCAIPEVILKVYREIFK